jgi:hypothetical protein
MWNNFLKLLYAWLSGCSLPVRASGASAMSDSILLCVVVPFHANIYRQPFPSKKTDVLPAASYQILGILQNTR